MTPLLLSILVVSSLTLSGMAAISYLFPRDNSPHEGWKVDFLGVAGPVRVETFWRNVCKVWW